MTGPRMSDLDPKDLLDAMHQAGAPDVTLQDIKDMLLNLDEGQAEGKRLTERMQEILSDSPLFKQLEKDPGFIAAMSQLPDKLGYPPTRNIVTLMKAMVGLTLAYLERG